MNNNEELVTNVTENVEEVTTEEIAGGVEETTEEVVETPKTYTDEEVDKIIQKRLGRQERTLKKDFEKQLSTYKEMESVLNAGLGTSNIEEATNNLKEFYEKKGVVIPKYEPTYNENDMKVLANAEANYIIDLGFEDVVEEVDRLAEIGVDNMTPREKLVFTQLAEYRKVEQDRQELAKIGVKEEALQDKEFVDFAKFLNPNMSVKEKYETYLKYRPKPNIEPMGSMKSTVAKDDGVKDFYTYEESLQFSRKDLRANPKLKAAIEQSMLKWKK